MASNVLTELWDSCKGADLKSTFELKEERYFNKLVENLLRHGLAIIIEPSKKAEDGRVDQGLWPVNGRRVVGEAVRQLTKEFASTSWYERFRNSCESNSRRELTKLLPRSSEEPRDIPFNPHKLYLKLCKEQDRDVQPDIFRRYLVVQKPACSTENDREAVEFVDQRR